MASLTGRGVKARVNGETVLIGKAEMFGRDGFAPLSDETAQTIERLREQGRTTMVVRLGDRDLGAIGLMDTPRAAAKDAIARLKILGIQRMIMLSGDNQRVATAVAADVGIEEAWGDLMPEDKVEAIGRLRAQTPVAMRSEEHTSELQSLMRISYAVFCLKKKKLITYTQILHTLKSQ